MLSTIVVGLLCAAPLQDVDNPEYKLWASFKKGAYVKLKTVIDPSPGELELGMTRALIEVTAEKVVIEHRPSPTPMGALPPYIFEIPAKLKSSVEPVQPPGDEKKPEVKEGDEEIDVAGKKMKCHWVETVTKEVMNDENVTSTTRVWTSPAIPGGEAQLVTTTEGKLKSITKTWVVEFKAE